MGIFGSCACADSGVNSDSCKIIAERESEKYTSDGRFIGAAVVQPQFAGLSDPDAGYIFSVRVLTEQGFACFIESIFPLTSINCLTAGLKSRKIPGADRLIGVADNKSIKINTAGIADDLKLSV